jgi:hypothetical protein
MKQAEVLIEERTSWLESALKSGFLTEVHAEKIPIIGGREKLTNVNEQQRQVTHEHHKL